MSTESEPDFVLSIPEDMVYAGAEQLKLYDPESENPLSAVVRIYFAMELVRETIARSMLTGMPALDKSQLN